jgi:hypothetical protein
MSNPLTADDLLPLIAKLSNEERHRLLRLAFRQGSTDADAYAAQPVTPDEFGSDDDPLAWEAEGWEGEPTGSDRPTERDRCCACNTNGPRTRK